MLQESDGNDVVTSCIVCDIDQDGDLEDLIGTYGQVFILSGVHASSLLYLQNSS